MVKERYGAWDQAEPDPQRKFKIKVFTLSPNDPVHCLTLDEAQRQVDQQVRFRAQNGFKYLFVRDFFDAPWYKRYEILPDGTERELPLSQGASV